MKFDEFDLFLYPWKKKKPCVKIIDNFSFPTRFLPVKKKNHPWKNPNKCPWKLSTACEKFEKSVRESHFPSVKKVEKRQKKAFTGTFDFDGKKKTLVINTHIKGTKLHFQKHEYFDFWNYNTQIDFLRCEINNPLN